MQSQKANQVGIRTIFDIRILFALLLLGTSFVSCKNDDSFKLSTLSDDISNQKYVNILENKLSNLPMKGQVAIALVHNGHTEYLGVTNENGTLKGIDNANKIFEIGSITKAFTSICLSKMIATNEASLTETLQNQFNFSLKAGDDITLQNLANHTSGLPVTPTNVDEVQGFNAEDPYAIYTYDNLKSYLQNHIVLKNAIGTNYEYSNLGTGILAYVLAKKRNSTVEDMMQSTIFNPLGMTSTTTLLNKVDKARLVKPRDINGNIVSHWNFTEIMSGCGSIKSSVMDMTKFIQKNFEDDAIYNLPQEKTFNVGNNLHTGLGWNIFEDDRFTIHVHDGGTGGYSSILMLDKGKEIGVIILSNVEKYHSTITPMCNDFILEINP